MARKDGRRIGRQRGVAGPFAVLALLLALVGGLAAFALDVLSEGADPPTSAAADARADGPPDGEAAAGPRKEGEPVVTRPGTGQRVPVEAATLAAAAGPEVPERATAPVRAIDAPGVTHGPAVEGPLLREPTTVVLPPAEEPGGTPYRLAIVREAGLVDLRSHLARLAHVEPPSPEERCTRPDGAGTWPCGVRARAELRRLIRRRALACSEVKPPDAQEAAPRLRSAAIDGPEAAPLRVGGAVREPPEGAKEVKVSRCSVGGTDLSAWLLEHGWARPAADAPADLLALYREARAEGRGLWAPDPR